MLARLTRRPFPRLSPQVSRQRFTGEGLTESDICRLAALSRSTRLGAFWVLLEQPPQQGCSISPSFRPAQKVDVKPHQGTLRLSELHDFILLEGAFRMKSAQQPLSGNGHFYSQ